MSSDQRPVPLKIIVNIAASAAIALVAIGCDSGTEWESGEYEVYWIDVSSDLTLGRKLPDGNSIGRVGPQVFAVGADDRWVVATRHPDGDKTKKEYYYFAKSMDGPYKNGEEVALGPFTEKEFADLRAKHGLPEFSKRF
jgi:hypothetical protein